MNLTELLLERLADRECSRCGRRLTDPDSIKNGIGPVCEKHNHKLTVKYGIIHLGHHPNRLMRDGKDEITFGKFFNKFPEADIVIVAGEYHYDGYLNAEGYQELNEAAVHMAGHLIDANVNLECVHKDSTWLALIGMDNTYIGPTDLSYDEFVELEGWAPGMCMCIGDYSWYQDIQEDLWEEFGEKLDNEPGGLQELLFSKLESRLWDPRYWEPLFEDSLLTMLDTSSINMIV